MKTAEEIIDEYYPEISDKDNNREYRLSLKDFRELQRGAFMVGYKAAKKESGIMLPIKARHNFLGDVEIIGIRIECNTNNNIMYMVKRDEEYLWVYDYETEIIKIN